MIKINKNSMHYSFLRYDCRGSVPENLCPYMRKLLFESIVKFFIISLAIFLAALFVFGLLDPFITMLGFYIGNGWSFPDYLPHVSYMDSYFRMIGFWAMGVFGGAAPAVQELVIFPFEHDYSFLGLCAWLPQVCSGAVILGSFLLVFAVTFFLMFLFVNIKAALEDRRERLRSNIQTKSEEKPDSFTALVYKYYKAKHDKFCPALEFVDDNKK